jgi:hypothetical protein
MQAIEDGQFDDADEGTDLVASIRAAYSYIDNSDSDSEDLEIPSDSDLESSDEDIRVEDEDWEKAEKGGNSDWHP